MAAPVAEGDRLAVLGDCRATVKAAGKSHDTAIAHFFTMRDDKVLRYEEVLDSADIAEAYRGAGSAAHV
jgi:ketosteroid isomerase-like protein